MEGERERLIRLCERLGAERKQAEVMAHQLLKRADQVAREREISRSDAMKYLLNVLVYGRRGQVYPGGSGDGVPRENG